MERKCFKDIKKYFLVLLLTFNVCVGFSQQNGLVKFYYGNGKVSSEGNFVNGKPDGIWKSYYETGILKSEGNRVNTQLEGIWKFYSEKGNKTAEYNYESGIKNG